MTDSVLGSPEQLRAIQLTQLELLCEARRICELRGIHYNIIAGTLLGARRHGGFIPWDDDADIAFLREEYEKFRLACERDLDSGKYYFQDHRNTAGYRWGYGKLRKKGTALVVAGTEHLPYEQGVWIDIFPLDFVPDCMLGRTISNFHCFCIRKLLYSEAGRLREKSRFLRFLYTVLSHMDDKAVFGHYEKYVSVRNRKRTQWVRILLFPTPNKEYGYRLKWYENSSDTVFENEIFSGIHDYDEYLSFKFGNWKELPPPEERKQHKFSRIKVYRMKKVITYGTFDLFHSGHYNLLKSAKALGDYLIVGVTTEQYDKQRGKLNVVDPILKRIENVKNTGFADEIVVEDHLGQKLEDIQRYNIDIFTVGSDWTGEFDAFREYCEVVYLERTKDVSSTQLREKMHNIVSLGIIGSGNIASRFVVEARYVSGINSAGVYNPRVESAKRFAGRFELGFYEDRLEPFLERVDAVYIASPHHTHVDYAKKALESGKHVFCEKPMAMGREDVDMLYEIAAEKGLVLSEAIKTASCPGFLQLVSVAKSGVIGSIRDVEACFTKLVPADSREWRGGSCGAFMELSSYPLIGIFKLLGFNYEEVFFDYFVTENNVDYYSKAYFKYKNALATAKTGIGVKSDGSMTISGTKGYITVQAPWWKTSEFTIHYEDPGSAQSYHSSFQGEGLRYELSDFVHTIHNKTVPAVSPGESAAIAGVIGKFIEKRGKING